MGKFPIWLKRILFIVLLIAVFLAGRFYAFFSYINTVMSPVVYSDSKTRETINLKFSIELPQSARDLYYSRDCSWFSSHFAAFTIDDEKDMEVFFEDIGIEKNEWKIQTQLPEQFTIYHNYPDCWESQYKDAGWQLSQEAEYLVAESRSGCVLYVPQKHRIYLAFFSS
jgi:hypothetical protein